MLDERGPLDEEVRAAYQALSALEADKPTRESRNADEQLARLARLQVEREQAEREREREAELSRLRAKKQREREFERRQAELRRLLPANAGVERELGERELRLALLREQERREKQLALRASDGPDRRHLKDAAPVGEPPKDVPIEEQGEGMISPGNDWDQMQQSLYPLRRNLPVCLA